MQISDIMILSGPVSVQSDVRLKIKLTSYLEESAAAAFSYKDLATNMRVNKWGPMGRSTHLPECNGPLECYTQCKRKNAIH